MSLDYTCYSLAARPLTPRSIAEAVPSWSLALMDADTSRPLHRARGLPPYCLVWACRSAARIDLRRLLRSADGSNLESLLYRGQVGCCDLELTKFTADPEFLATLPKRQHTILAAARSRYDTRTSAGQSDLSWQLQLALCRAIALASGGLLEDPQVGTLRVVSARR